MSDAALVIGAGPGGLMAAQVLAQGGRRVVVCEALGSPGRKFLRAGVGGLNLTHSQDFEAFLESYGPDRPKLEPYLRAFGPQEVRDWAGSWGCPTFVGTSGRVFPQGVSAGDLLGAWVRGLEGLGVEIRCLWRWVGWSSPGAWVFETPEGSQELEPAAVVLALGGASWPALGTGGSWKPLLEDQGCRVAPFQSANCGIRVPWSRVFREKWVRQPVKALGLLGRVGEVMITEEGLEGGLIYAGGRTLRENLGSRNPGVLTLDLMPDWPLDRLRLVLAGGRGKLSWSEFLRKKLHLSGVKIALAREVLGPWDTWKVETLPETLKGLTLTYTGLGPLDTAISCAGGLVWEEVTPALELHRMPRVFCAGEMLDWEAPTGGYLLTACFSLGYAAGKNALASWPSKD